MKSIGLIAGSAFSINDLEPLQLEKRDIPTPWGTIRLYECTASTTPAFIRFRHETPHRLLPNQIPYRAQAWAFREVACSALLITSSVGVLDAEVPLYTPLHVTDLLMPENRLPDGSQCTMFQHPQMKQGHLVLNEGLFSDALRKQLDQLAANTIIAPGGVVFAYAAGPRTKTPAENRYWATLGAQVNSMTLGPEVVLANELEIPCAGLVVGHKYSVPGIENPDRHSVAASLQFSREAMQKLITGFILTGKTVSFQNHLFRFNHDE